MGGSPGDSVTYVKFNDEYRASRSYPSEYLETPRIIQWVIKYSGGYIKEEKQAIYVLIVFVAVAIAISLFLIFGGSNGPNISLPRDARIIYPQNEPPRLQQPLMPNE